MAVRIRMKRMGRRHRPFYRICVMDARRPRDGKAIEEIGTYDPMVREKNQRVSIDLERVDHWLGVGAQPTEKVAVLIKKLREDDWGQASAPPPMTPPKAPPEPEPEAAEGSDESGEGAEATEETAEGESSEG